MTAVWTATQPQYAITRVPADRQQLQTDKMFRWIFRHRTCSGHRASSCSEKIVPRYPANHYWRVQYWHTKYAGYLPKQAILKIEAMASSLVSLQPHTQKQYNPETLCTPHFCSALFYWVSSSESNMLCASSLVSGLQPLGKFSCSTNEMNGKIQSLTSNVQRRRKSKVSTNRAWAGLVILAQLKLQRALNAKFPVRPTLYL